MCTVCTSKLLSLCKLCTAYQQWQNGLCSPTAGMHNQLSKPSPRSDNSNKNLMRQRTRLYTLVWNCKCQKPAVMNNFQIKSFIAVRKHYTTDCLERASSERSGIRYSLALESNPFILSYRPFKHQVQLCKAKLAKIFTRSTSTALCSYHYHPFQLAVQLCWANLAKIFSCSGGVLRSYCYRPFNHQPFRWGSSLPPTAPLGCLAANANTTFAFGSNRTLYLKDRMRSRVYFLSTFNKEKSNQFPVLTFKSSKLKYQL